MVKSMVTPNEHVGRTVIVELREPGPGIKGEFLGENEEYFIVKDSAGATRYILKEACLGLKFKVEKEEGSNQQGG